MDMPRENAVCPLLINFPDSCPGADHTFECLSIFVCKIVTISFISNTGCCQKAKLVINHLLIKFVSGSFGLSEAFGALGHSILSSFFAIFMTEMKLRFLIACALSVLQASCGLEPLPPETGKPEILDAYVESVTIDGAMLKATVSDGGLVEQCGFHLYQMGSAQSMTYNAVCTDNTFAVFANGLRPDTGYEFEAFVDNGNGLSIKSERHPFVTLEADSGLPSYAFSFETFALREFDTNHDGVLSTEEALAVRSMTVSTDSIPSITHLERFNNLDTLICRPHRMTYKSLLRDLDLSGNPSMRYLNAVRNDMETISFPQNSELRYVNIGFNNYVTLDLSTLLKTEYVNLTGCHRLQTIYLAKGQKIEITGASSATIIYYD